MCIYVCIYIYVYIITGLQQKIITNMKSNKVETISTKIEINKNSHNIQTNQAFHEIFENDTIQNIKSIQSQQNEYYYNTSLRLLTLTEENENIISTIDNLNITIYDSYINIIQIFKSIINLNETYLNKFFVQNDTMNKILLDFNHSKNILNSTLFDIKYEFNNVSLDLRYIYIHL
jgi:hypothetical protein